MNVPGEANLCEQLDATERADMLISVEQAVRNLLLALRVDQHQDANVRETPRRVAPMLITETLAGRYDPCPSITEFENLTSLDELYVVGPVSVRSTCAHHLAPIIGQAWVGVLPDQRIIGLSKFSRVVDWVMARLQMQESATQQLADVLEQAMQPRGLGVVVRARHLCMSWRGVREPHADMTTSVMRGWLRDRAPLRAEFLSLIGHQL